MPVTAITLFVADLAAAKEFYARAFALPVHWEDDVSAVFDLGNTLVNLLQESEAPELIAPAVVAPAGSGARMQFTISVPDVDAAVAEMPTGSSMSLHDALATMLIPSASNYADAVSTWAFGSRSAFLSATDDYLAREGLTGTTIVVDGGLTAATR